MFSISLGTAVIPRRNKKQRFKQNFGGQIRCIMGDVQVAYRRRRRTYMIGSKVEGAGMVKRF